MQILGWIGSFIYLFTFIVFLLTLKEEVCKILRELRASKKDRDL